MFDSVSMGVPLPYVHHVFVLQLIHTLVTPHFGTHLLLNYLVPAKKLIHVVGNKESPQVSGHSILSTPWSLYFRQSLKSMV